MLIEQIEQRALGAIRLVDSTTGAPLDRAIRVESSQLTLNRNLRGYYVIASARGLENHTADFLQPPSIPPVGSLAYRVTITDPLQQFLPRDLTLALPRDPDPANRNNADSLFLPHNVALYPASTVRLSHNWSTVRVSVNEGANTGVRGALVHIVDMADDTLLASGISDDRGEALVIVPGVPVTRFADDDEPPPDAGEAPVLVSTVSARLEVSVAADRTWPVDPDELELGHGANLKQSVPISLSTAQTQSITIDLT